MQVGVHSLQLLTTLSLQSAAALASYTPSVPIHCPLRGFLTGPMLPPPLGLGKVGANTTFLDLPHHFAAVVSLVRHHSHRPIWLDHLYAGRIIHRFRNDAKMLGGLRQCFLYCVRIARVGRLSRDRHYCSRLHIHRVLGLVRQVSPPVLHFRDARIRIVRVRPF